MQRAIYQGVSLKLRGKTALLQPAGDHRGEWVRTQFDDVTLTGSGGINNCWGLGWNLLPKSQFKFIPWEGTSDA